MTPRPLSPHLPIYRPMLTMVMSIVHRITGAALYFGTILLVAWLSRRRGGARKLRRRPQHRRLASGQS